jgi:hypothetical protein
MTKVKKFFDWFFRVGISILLVIFLVVAPFTIMPNLLSSQANINRTESFEYEGILELWHIETFEGGSVSRATFLEKQAIAFEKEHRGTYIVTKTMSLEQFKLNIQNGEQPNMLSFGIGVGDDFVNDICEINLDCGIRDDLLVGGKFNSKQLAIPYILGGYCLITKTENNFDNIGVGSVGTNNPFKAAQINNININFSTDIDCDTYSAYDKFIKGSYSGLLGTQRDVYRVYNRQQKGLISNACFNFLGGYTDLVQYVSVFKSSSIEETMCQKFVQKLVSESTQQKLSSYNLFSVLDSVSLYTDDIFGTMEKTLKQPLETYNCFLNEQTINLEKTKYFSIIKE